jgi:hypothetical protein
MDLRDGKIYSGFSDLGIRIRIKIWIRKLVLLP